MKSRFVIKVAGAAGQGIKSSGMIVSRALKRAGYASFGYTEYPSLIRGGHNVFQIEIANRRLQSITAKTHLLLALNEESVRLHMHELADDSVLIYDAGTFTIKEDQLAEYKARSIDVIEMPLLKLAKEQGGSAIMKNTVALGAVWRVFGLDPELLKQTVAEIFNKSEEIIKLNQACVEAGYKAVNPGSEGFTSLFPEPGSTDFSNDLLITGNEAFGLGAIAGGVRLYSSYPMTPASSILSYLAVEGTKYGMIVKQAEDEITAVNMVIGASVAGTRALCGTSGGGFDLMTEALSLAGIIETPLTVILGQRPGPATGVPTWTAQGDLNLALYAGHGEFPRIVAAAGDAKDAYLLMQHTLNFADRFQTPVILLTDKMLAESVYSIDELSSEAVAIDRGKLISDEQAEEYASAMRYELSEDGISARWLPGSKGNTYLANSDEHTPKGYSTEEATEIQAMMDKRMRKYKAIKEALPEPEVFGEQTDPDLVILSWGSNKGSILDAIDEADLKGKKVSYIHYSWLWPLKTEKAAELISRAGYVFSVEVNYTAQFTELFEQQAHIEILDRYTKYDGRPFYLEELITYIETAISKLN